MGWKQQSSSPLPFEAFPSCHFVWLLSAYHCHSSSEIYMYICIMLQPNVECCCSTHVMSFRQGTPHFFSPHHLIPHHFFLCHFHHNLWVSYDSISFPLCHFLRPSSIMVCMTCLLLAILSAPKTFLVGRMALRRG